MKLLHRALRISLRNDFQSYWTTFQPLSTRWNDWPMNSYSWNNGWPMSCLSQLEHERPWIPHTNERATSIDGYFERIKDYMVRTDDIPTPGNQPKLLSYGVYFPKTRHVVMIGLNQIEYRDWENREKISGSYTLKMIHEWFAYRNELKKERLLYALKMII